MTGTVLAPQASPPRRLRKSFGGGGGPRPMTINDDAAEREANRRRRSSTHGRRSSIMGGPDKAGHGGPQLSNESLSMLYSSTIKMLQDNKINMKNSWSLNLLDHIDDIVQIKDDSTASAGVNTNFQMAGCTLDAGAKIYSNRVESLHNNVFKVRGGLILGQGDEEQETEGTVEEEEEQTKRKPKRRGQHHSTLETNMDNITSKSVDVELGVDPLFQKMSAAFDEGGARGMLLNTLHVGAGCEIIFDSDTIFDEAMAVRPDSNEDPNRIYDLGELGRKLLAELEDENKFVRGLCPTFTAYREAKEQNRVLAAEDASEEQAPEAHAEISFDYAEDDFANAGAQQFDSDAVLREKMMLASLREDEDNVDDATQDNDDPEVGILSKGTVVDPFYFDADLLKNWAGPTHWRFHRTLGAAKNGAQQQKAAREKRPRGKTAALLDFDNDPTDIDFAKEFKPLKGSGQLSKAVLEKMKERRNTLPDDLHYRTVDLTRLFLRPELSVLSGRRGRQAPADGQDDAIADGGGIYDFDNDCDNANFCPAIDGFGEEAAAGDAHDDFGHINLVDEPAAVEKLDIKYATTSKSLDVRALKDSIWKDLNGESGAGAEPEPEAYAPADARRSGEGINRSLQDVVEDLPKHVPSKALGEVSISYVFICLLHLANENNLRVLGQEDLSDLIIQKQ